MTTKVTLNQDDVLKVYSGKLGCMCGCKGKYKYASKHQVLGGKDRGYDVGDDEVSDRSVKRMVNKFNKMDGFQVDVQDGIMSDYVFIETDTRMYCIYLLKGTLSNKK